MAAGRGYLIAFEGGEGAGKTSQLARAAASLQDAGYAVLTTREPGGTPLGERVREVLLDPAAAVAPRAELLLYLAARAQLTEEVLRPALAAGKVVLLDRFVHSTLAYQGYGLGVDVGGADGDDNLRRLRDLCLVATGRLWPDLVILLDVRVEVGLGRLRAGAGQNSMFEDRVESRDLAFHRRVRDGFLVLAAAEPDIIKIVDGARPPDAVAADVAGAVASFF